MTSLRAISLALLGLALLAGDISSAAESDTGKLSSPDGRLELQFNIDEQGSPRYSLTYEGKPALLESRLGLVGESFNFSTEMRLESESNSVAVKDHYEILTAKRRVNDYAANRKTFHLVSDILEPGKISHLDVIFQLSNDGAAFRYYLPDSTKKVVKLKEEVSSFHFLPGTMAWLEPMADPKSGWQDCNPCYEVFYKQDIPAGSPSTFGLGWAFPALFRSGENWLLLSETGLGRNYCGSRLRPDSIDGEYSIGFPDPREGFGDGPVNPESTLPWTTPWRIIVVGSLKTIAESMLGVDLADPPSDKTAKAVAASKIPPHGGKASWSWPLLGDKKTTYEVQKRFIDYAADMHWGCCLVDALWDQQIGYDKLKELVEYGKSKDVRILVWENSAGDWNTTPQTPRGLMLSHESRIKEFERLKAIGVAGVKIDFFGGDGQSTIDYYHDILDDAAPYGFLMNFHGATLPRGWERTYPQLMTMEAVRGLEYETFAQEDADEMPTHAAMLPFTRNVFDPMDFTPMALDKLPRTQRRTTSAFELALALLFTSGIQHYAETPEGMAKVPEIVRNFIKGIPKEWDDMKFLDGYPGKYVVIARRGGGMWFVAGINAGDDEMNIAIDLDSVSLPPVAHMIADGDGGNLSFRSEDYPLAKGRPIAVTMKPHGGFVMNFY